MTSSIGRRRLLAALGVALALPRSAIAQQSASTATADPPGALVSASWLTGRLEDQNLLVLDIRSAADGGGFDAFRTGHIPGAVHSNYDTAGWRVTRGRLPLMLPTIPQLEALIGDLGIDSDSRVVVVSAGLHASDFSSAARVYWTLKVSGVTSVSILDGGFAAWRAAPGSAMESGSGQISPTIFTATIDKNLVAELDEVEGIERRGGATLVDARRAAFFSGKTKVAAVKAFGHIPRALNLDSAAFYDFRANRLKPKAELAKIAAALPDGPIVTYCNSGQWSATDWFVLSELLQRKNVKLYFGSMIEWASDPRRRLETVHHGRNLSSRSSLEPRI